MKRFIVHIFLSFFIFLSHATSCTGQIGFYVPLKGKIFFTGDSATVFSNIINTGQFGIGQSAVVNFKGRLWENSVQSIITDESNSGDGVAGIGGKIRFLIPNDSLASVINQKQLLIGGYNAASRSGPAFTNIEINNRWGLELLSGTTKVRHTLHFTDGRIYLNDNILVIGDQYPGIITGYNEKRFVVTGARSNSSFLLREGLKATDGMISFPVGSSDTSYTPLMIRSHEASAGDFFAAVSDSVFANGFNGAALSSETVNKTWMVGQPANSYFTKFEVVLQHLLKDEGTEFSQYRQRSYVSQYVNGKWNETNNRSAPVSPATITTGNLLTGSGMNSIVLNHISNTVYLTKFASYYEDTTAYKNKCWFSGYRTDWKNVKLYWTTKPEMNNKYFVVQRMLSNETVFTNIDTVASKALNGVSFSYLNYTLHDPNDYRGVTYYRLLMINYAGNITDSQIVAIGGKPGGSQIVLWPNPTTGRFFAGISSISAVKSIVIWNAIGQKIREIEVKDRGLIEMSLFTPGTYAVGFISHSGQIIETKKLVVVPY